MGTTSLAPYVVSTSATHPTKSPVVSFMSGVQISPYFSSFEAWLGFRWASAPLDNFDLTWGFWIAVHFVYCELTGCCRATGRRRRVEDDLRVAGDKMVVHGEVTVTASAPHSVPVLLFSGLLHWLTTVYFHFCILFNWSVVGVSPLRGSIRNLLLYSVFLDFIFILHFLHKQHVYCTFYFY